MNMKNAIVLAALAAALVAGCKGKERARDSYPNAPVIIISVDTLRADRLPMFGYTKVETPALTALRNESILFTNAYSNVPLTFPSHTAMLTGLLPPDNKVRNNIGFSLDPKLPTIPKALKAKGYETGAAISSYVLRGNVGLGASFDFYDDGVVSKANVPVGALQRSGTITADIAKRWVSERKDKPFFFLLHLFEPHSPYDPPEPFRSRYADRYDGEIATADQIVGGFLAQLKTDGTYDKAVIVFMSDHGEGLYEHGEPEHGIFLYREAIHVPLMVKLPGGARGGETDKTPVSLIDIFPTIAQLTGATAPANLKGKSLLAHSEADAARRVYSETIYPRVHLGWSELRSLADAQHHFIQAPKPELYDVVADPGEKTNILADQRRVYATMRDELGTFGSDVNVPTNIDPEEAKKLAALGYLGSSAPQTSGPLPDPKDRIGEVRDMMDAMKLVTEEKHQQAIEAFRRILKANPRLADAWNQLGTSLEIQGRYEEAADAYKKAIETTPELGGEFGLRLGSVLFKLEKFDDAAAHARLGEKVNYGGSHLLLARIALAQKDFKTAEKEALISEKDQYSRVPAKVLRAQAYAQQNRAQEAFAIAQEVAQEAQQRQMGNVESLEFVRGDSLARMERYPEAEEAFRREIAAFPHNRQAYASLYLVYMLTNRPAEARQALEEMARANPNRRAYLFAAHTAEALGDNGAAAMWRQRATSVR